MAYVFLIIRRAIRCQLELCCQGIVIPVDWGIDQRGSTNRFAYAQIGKNNVLLPIKFRLTAHPSSDN